MAKGRCLPHNAEGERIWTEAVYSVGGYDSVKVWACPQAQGQESEKDRYPMISLTGRI